MDLRRATPADADDLARIQRRALRERATEAYTDVQLAPMLAPDRELVPPERLAASDHVYVVAERDDRTVGYGGIHLDDGVLAATFVDPDLASEGIGSAIVERLEALAREHDVETLTTYASLNAEGFYERLGFEPVERVTVGADSDPEIPSVLMRKPLP